MAKHVILWSATTGGFYLKGLSTHLPDDAAPVSTRRHEQLLAAQAQGGRIITGKNGKPIIDWPVAPDLRDTLGKRIKYECARRIDLVSPAWRQMNDLREPSAAGVARFAAIDTLRAASNLIEQDLAQTKLSALAAFPVPDHPLWPAELQES